MIPPKSGLPLYSANNINLEENSTVYFSVSSQQKKLVKKITQITNDQFIIELYMKMRSPAEKQANVPIVNHVTLSFTLNKDSFVIDSTTNLIRNTLAANKSTAKKSTPVHSKKKHTKKPYTCTKNISIKHEYFIKAICRYFLVYRKKNHHEILDILL